MTPGLLQSSLIPILYQANPVHHLTPLLKPRTLLQSSLIPILYQANPVHHLIPLLKSRTLKHGTLQIPAKHTQRVYDAHVLKLQCSA